MNSMKPLPRQKTRIYGEIDPKEMVNKVNSELNEEGKEKECNSIFIEVAHHGNKSSAD